MDGMELKLAHLHYLDGNLYEAIRCLNKSADKYFATDLGLDKDPFWKTLAKHVYLAVILNDFHKGNEVKNSSLIERFSNLDTVKNDIKEFCEQFANSNSITFIPYLEKSTDNMLSSAMGIIVEGIKKHIL